jgi:hypothetical protein
MAASDPSAREDKLFFGLTPPNSTNFFSVELNKSPKRDGFDEKLVETGTVSMLALTKSVSTEKSDRSSLISSKTVVGAPKIDSKSLSLNSDGVCTELLTTMGCSHFSDTSV